MEGKIYGAISATMAEIGAVGKNKRNQQQNFMYRGVDDVMNALKPALAKHKIFVVPEVIEQKREERTSQKGGLLIYSVCTVKYTFFADDGSHVTAIVIGEGMDSGDKATNKAMSIAFKYACFQVFCIPTEEMQDPDNDSPDPKPSDEVKEIKEQYINKNSLDAIRAEIERTGIKEAQVLKTYKVKSLDEMTNEQAINCLRLFEKTPDKEIMEELNL